MADGDRTFLDRTLSDLRRERSQAVAAWRAAGGVWAVGGTPTHPRLFRVVQDAERRYFDLSVACLPSHPNRLLHRLRRGERDAIETALGWLEGDPFARQTGYLKQKIMRRLSQIELSDADRERLQRVLLTICTRGKRQEFEEARRLARRRLASPEFAEELQALADGTNSPVTRTAAVRMLLAVKSAM